MAYPTLAQLNFKSTETFLGTQPVMESATAQKHPLGTRIKAQDYGSLNYGEAEFIYLKGVASTAAGDVVVYDPVAATTTRTVLASRGPLAVAMSANVASQFGWYCVRGAVPVNTTAAGTGAANAQLALTATNGQLTVGSAIAGYLFGIECKTAQDTPTVGFTQVQLTYASTGGFTATGFAIA